MKRIWVALILLMVVLGAGIAGTCYTDFVMRNMDSFSVSIAEQVKKQDLSAARKTEEEMHSFWDNNSPMLCVFLDHNQLEAVDGGIEELRIFLEKEECNWALTRCAGLQETVGKLRKLELPLPENIF